MGMSVMRPEKAYLIISNAVCNYYRDIDKTAVYSNEFKLAVDKLIKKSRIDVRKSNASGIWGDIIWEYDERDPYEVYGYENQESIDNNMMYISDRFNCEFRLNWLKCGVENNEF